MKLGKATNASFLFSSILIPQPRYFAIISVYCDPGFLLLSFLACSLCSATGRAQGTQPQGRGPREQPEDECAAAAKPGHKVSCSSPSLPEITAFRGAGLSLYKSAPLIWAYKICERPNLNKKPRPFCCSPGLGSGTKWPDEQLRQQGLMIPGERNQAPVQVSIHDHRSHSWSNLAAHRVFFNPAWGLTSSSLSSDQGPVPSFSSSFPNDWADDMLVKYQTTSREETLSTKTILTWWLLSSWAHERISGEILWPEIIPPDWSRKTAWKWLTNFSLFNPAPCLEPPLRAGKACRNHCKYLC